MFWQFMQIISLGGNQHEVSKPIFWEKNTKKYFKMTSVEHFTQHAKL